MSDPRLSGVRIHVHTEGPELSGLRRLMSAASAPLPLDERLATMCLETAALARVDVASAYVVEGDGLAGKLVMRGNHGFPASAVGAVQLPLGEGITGLVAERMRPVSVSAAAEHAQFSYVPGIGEEEFPSFLGVPIATGDRALGVLVLQRRGQGGFSPREVTFAMALSAPFATALDGRDAVSDRPDSMVRLRGRAAVEGSAFGWVRRAPTLTDQIATAHGRPAPRVDVENVLDRVAGDLVMLQLVFARRGMRAPIALARAADALADDAFRDHVRQRVELHGLLAALARVAHDYRRRFGRGLGRTEDIAELCAVMAGCASPGELIGGGTVLIAYRLGWPMAMVAALEGCNAALVEDLTTPEARAIARAARIPLAERVGGLWTWTQHNDLILLDEDARVHVNPGMDTLGAFFDR